MNIRTTDGDFVCWKLALDVLPLFLGGPGGEGWVFFGGGTQT